MSTPYKLPVRLEKTGGVLLVLADADGQEFFAIDQDEKEQAYAVVRAVNAHDDLISALREAIGVIEIFHGEAGWQDYQSSPEMQRFRIALAKAAPAERKG